mmetsp:Transcript_1899/g.5566  ORF Transcript_1899/g.5566 Transcript_1899/m.5566 type:complete len:223 (-) Transcript_1899:3296-3964(-)
MRLRQRQRQRQRQRKWRWTLRMWRRQWVPKAAIMPRGLTWILPRSEPRSGSAIATETEIASAISLCLMCRWAVTARPGLHCQSCQNIPPLLPAPQMTWRSMPKSSSGSSSSWTPWSDSTANNSSSMKRMSSSMRGEESSPEGGCSCRCVSCGSLHRRTANGCASRTLLGCLCAGHSSVSAAAGVRGGLGGCVSGGIGNGSGSHGMGSCKDDGCKIQSMAMSV